MRPFLAKMSAAPRLAAMAATFVVVSTSAIANAQTWQYPACSASSETNCAMQKQGPTPDSTGKAIIHVLFYGKQFGNVFGKSLWDQSLPDAVEGLVKALSDSSYLMATAQTYELGLATLGLDVAFDSNGTVGSTLNGSGAIEGLLEDDMQLFHSPSTNDVYLLVVSSDITITGSPGGGGTFCPNLDSKGNCACGYNASFVLGGNRYKYGALVNGSNTGTTCQWGFHTPNDLGGTDLVGVFDRELNAAAHEINEALLQAWTLSTPIGTNNQTSDFCQAQTAAPPYTLTGTSIKADFHGNNTDFMLQPQRYDTGSGAQGYCVNSSGGTFYGQNFGWSWSPVGDWSNSQYKGECENGQPLVGMSTVPNSGQSGGLGGLLESEGLAGFPHAVMCGSGPNSADFQQSSSCHAVVFYPGGNQSGDGTDWDNGFYKGECATNEFAAGVSQTANPSSGAVTTILCCPGNVRHLTCETQLFNSSSPATPAYDWDDSFLKAECSSGRYLAGVSDVVSTGHPHKILCCNP